ncbi:LysM peptidoglycan-binding domain-containing protein [Aurantimonas sp. MSK8Z-1]|uniref:LysM peptidoglycan-binding domain-containing protein n=1 Tax=Mangrovibrevibacter kandeliae TaxID=2968473 RepID=UPI002118CFC2|nr:LysM peptidoglycan-binding domain-containing protein [Aurantimonas sp. MSK8Z-1]MCW4114134.1 LysM peptidoglycan-binding domain-containing protein [Aurantimonas sp. MSK8Z-1]
MKRRALLTLAVCIALFGAILAGYWDMLSSERMKVLRKDEADKGAVVSRTAADAKGASAPTAAPASPPGERQASTSVEPAPAASAGQSPAPAQSTASGSQPAAGSSSDPSAVAAAPDASAASDSAADAGGGPTTEDLAAAPQPEAAGAGADAHERLPRAEADGEAGAGATGARETAAGAALPDHPPRSADTATPAEATSPDRPAMVARREAPATPEAGRTAPGPGDAHDETAARELPRTPGKAGADPQRPHFDLLRVEPDGSTVLAGRGPAHARIALTDGTRELGSDTANASGEFVVVLGDRLPAGTHSLQLEATTPEGRRTRSEETAVVDVPARGHEADLLAMIEAPNQPSRLITLPEQRDQGTPSAASPDRPADIRAGAGSSASLKDAARGNANPQAAELAPAAPPAANAEATPPDAALPRTKTGPAGAASDAQTLPRAADVAVEAVEIENDTVYIAGRAPASAKVRIYVDDVYLAETPATDASRFLISRMLPLTVGRHRIRADAIGAGGTVLARAEVPFMRPEGERMSAIAPAPKTLALPATPDAAASKPEPQDETAKALPRTPAAGTEATPPQRAAAGQPAAGGDPAAPASASASAAAAASAPPTAVAQSSAPAAAPPPPARPELDRLATAAYGGRGAGEGVPDDRKPSGAEAPAPERATPDGEAAPGAAGAPPDGAGAEVSGQDDSLGESGGVATLEQPALVPGGGRVIIRKGDTLWRISRDTYGLGRRYTVIYLANGDQIRDPHWIYPGQVFRMPASGGAESGADGAVAVE